jgi:hypothetical protein
MRLAFQDGNRPATASTNGIKSTFLRANTESGVLEIFAQKVHDLRREPTLHRRHLFIGTTDWHDLTFAHIGSEARRIGKHFHDGSDHREV